MFKPLQSFKLTCLIDIFESQFWSYFYSWLHEILHQLLLRPGRFMDFTLPTHSFTQL